MARCDGVAKEPDDVGPIPLVIFIASFADENNITASKKVCNYEK
jgi:hypothetical protein